MAKGWSKEGDVQEQIENSVHDELERVRSQLPKGESRQECAECEEPIPKARQQAVPGVQFCIACQKQRDSAQKPTNYFNRRGSKDSQLK